MKELISSIKALENCITPFLDDCDQDKNEMISDYEWGRCLGLEDSNYYLNTFFKSFYLFVNLSCLCRRNRYFKKILQLNRSFGSILVLTTGATTSTCLFFKYS